MRLRKPHEALPKCGARTRKKGRCKQPVVPGTRRCYLHGGKTPAGMASPHYRHGRYSKVLPERLRRGYEVARQDPELLALADEIGVIDSRLQDLLGRVDSGESGRLWRELKAAWTLFKTAREAGDPEGMRLHLVTLESLLNRGVADYAAWDAITKQLTLRCGLVEVEHKRRVQMQQLMSLEQANLLFGVVCDIIQRHVADPPTLTAIAADLRALSHVGDGDPLSAESH